MDVAASDTSASASSGAENSDLKTERSASIDFLKQQVGKYYFFDCKLCSPTNWIVIQPFICHQAIFSVLL